MDELKIEAGESSPEKPKKRFKRLKRLLLAAGISAVLCVSAFFLIQLYIVGSAKPYLLGGAEDAPVCDAVMVLGAFVYSDGTPTTIVRDRLEYGYELYAAGKAKKILVSGDHAQEDYDEVNAMRQYLLDKGVPSEDIFMDHAGFNT
ncbi:MAG: YdcF family protein, partial [Oscillospiraceae bacterium]|nr:YdcF family protein [Oscillospiraceae bacterium]